MKVLEFQEQRLQELRVFFSSVLGRRWQSHLKLKLKAKGIHVPICLTSNRPNKLIDAKALGEVEEYAVGLGFKLCHPVTLRYPFERKRFEKLRALLERLNGALVASGVPITWSTLLVIEQHKFAVRPTWTDVISPEFYTITPAAQRTRSPMAGPATLNPYPVTVKEFLECRLDTPGIRHRSPGTTGDIPAPPRSLNPSSAEKKVTREDPIIDLYPDPAESPDGPTQRDTEFKQLVQRTEKDTDMPLRDRLHKLSRWQRFIEGRLREHERSELLADGQDITPT